MRQLLLIPLALFCADAMSQTDRATRNHEIASEYLDEQRVITVSLPPGYSDGDATYPVLYVLDGEWAFDYAVGAVAILSHEGIGHIPDMLVVGIPNTDRARDLRPTPEVVDDGGGYLGFLHEEVLSLVDREYRTSGFNLLNGWSSGSVIGMVSMMREPELFDAWLFSGTGIGPRSRAMLSERLPQNDYEHRFLYANTDGGPFAYALQDFSDLIESLEPEGLHWTFEVREDSTHLEVLPEGLRAGLSFVFSDFVVPESVIALGAEAVVAHLEEAQSRYATFVPIPIGSFVEAASGMLQAGQPDEAVALLRYAASHHPESAVLMGALGDVHAAIDAHADAARAYASAMQAAANDRALFLQNEAMHRKMLSLIGEEEAQ